MRSAMLRIKVLACPALFLTLDEVLRILRHRYIFVLVCLVSAPPLGFFIFNGNWPQAAGVILFPAMAIAALSIVIGWQARHFSRNGVTPIYLSIHFAAIALAAGVGQQVTQKGFVLPLRSDLPALTLWSIWSFVVAETATWVFVTFMLPLVLADLRKQDPGIPQAPLPDPAPFPDPSPLPEPVAAAPDQTPPSGPQALADAPLPPVQFVPEAPPELPEGPAQFVPRAVRFITIAREYIDFSELLYLRIERNYLDVVTTQRKMLLRSTLSEVVDQLTLDEGALVHRSYWVAKHAVRSALQRDGELFVELRNKEVIKVARPRKRFVLDWLNEADLSP